MLADMLVLMLGCPHLGADLLSTVPCLLFLLVGLLLGGEELHAWLRCHSPHRDRRDGLESRSVFWRWRACDVDSRDYHIAPSGVEGSGAPPMPEAATPS
jgi:hypothetical protein